MEAGDLETTLQATLAARAPSARDVRDALVDYFGLVGRSFVTKGLVHTDPEASDAVVRRMLVSRLALLWKGAGSTWDRPDLVDLAHLRTRIEQWSCVRGDTRYDRLRRLLDELFLAAAVTERMRAVRGRAPVRRFRLIEGGGELSPPRARLRLVRPAAVTPPASGGVPSSKPSSRPSSSRSSSPPSSSTPPDRLH